MLKTTFKRVLSSVALTATIIYGAIVAPEIHNKYLRYEVGESTVKVLHPYLNGGGTGFAIQAASGKQFIMTNAHVCNGVQVLGNVRLKLPDGKEVSRKVHKIDTVHDLCLIEGVKELKPLDIGSDQSKGDQLYVVGHPGLRQLTISHEEYIGRTSIELDYDVKTKQECPYKIIDIPAPWNFFLGKNFVCLRDYPALETTAVIYGGNSGSPVVNKWGNLIGVAFAGNSQQEHNNFVIPLRYVRLFLSKF